MGVVPFISRRLVIIILVHCISRSSGFMLQPQHNYDCGGQLDDVSGFIESPLFPESYPSEADCYWEISARPGHQIKLTSTWFFVEEQTECLWDYVRVLDGPDGEYGNQIHCGSSAIEYLSVSDVIKVEFHSDVSGSDAGFKIKYEQFPAQLRPDCNVTMTQEGEVTSPFYPSPYPNDVICIIKIKAPDQHKVELNFSTFEVETWPCTYDHLKIFWQSEKDGSYAMGTFCGKELPPLQTSEGNEMMLKFISDASLQSHGFKASLRFVPMPTPIPVTPASTTLKLSTLTSTASVSSSPLPLSTLSVQSQASTRTIPIRNDVCNTTIVDQVSNISSLGYPDSYLHQKDCVTKFRSDVLSKFVIRFYNFSLEQAENCTYDYLSIFSVEEYNLTIQNNSRKLLKRMCGKLNDGVIITSEGHGFDLVFHSDMSVNAAGYLANVVVTPIKETPRCPNVCQHGGTCMETLLPDGSMDWICMCTEDFTGVFCEIEAPQSCPSVACQNGGLCRTDPSGAVCVCPNGFRGRFCEEMLMMPEDGSLFFTKMAENNSLSIGSSAILECAVNDAKANVMWLFHDRILTNSDWSRGVEVHPGGVIVIPDVKDAHSGRYTCMAVTSDDLVERSIWISLIEACSLEVMKSPTNLTVQEGKAAMFQCFVPEADVTLWRKDGDLMTQGIRKRILVNDYLVIDPVVETDTGEYTCIARGTNGCFSKTSAYLTVETTGHGRECGKPRKPSGDGGGIAARITSGREAAKGSAPWHVVLRDDREGKTFCGGSLVSRDTVLTAAHCVSHFEDFFDYPFDPRHLQIFIGTHHCEGHNGIYRQLKWYKIHEQFDKTHFINDIAIFKLDQPVHYSDDVMSICLERPAFVEELMKPGQLGVVVGCGDRYTHGMSPTYLHEVQIPIVLRDICGERARNVNASFTEGMFCAGYARSMRGDACGGDSGGAFTLNFNGRSILVGIVSWGVYCDWENHYGYYTYASHYYDWITAQLDQE